MTRDGCVAQRAGVALNGLVKRWARSGNGCLFTELPLICGLVRSSACLIDIGL